MKQFDLLVRNAHVRRRFALNCARLRARIAQLQRNNQRLAQRLLALTERHQLLGDRVRACLAQSGSSRTSVTYRKQLPE
ncbi:hypothetical protein [Spirosoma sp.]|uniref:hypothetical protein n=1 Tax=Spirosoma sp. TaxID=1899569 RepID=UPI00263442B9|nr:hypothetical protein [Spirosoma sp.]MCX6212888.1 hypothetical protein [Spirosoma sp.]